MPFGSCHSKCLIALVQRAGAGLPLLKESYRPGYQRVLRVWWLIPTTRANQKVLKETKEPGCSVMRIRDILLVVFKKIQSNYVTVVFPELTIREQII